MVDAVRNVITQINYCAYSCHLITHINYCAYSCHLITHTNYCTYSCHFMEFSSFYFQARFTAHGRDTSIIYDRRCCLTYIKRLLIHSITNCPGSVGCRYISWRCFGSLCNLQEKDKVCYSNFIKLK